MNNFLRSNFKINIKSEPFVTAGIVCACILLLSFFPKKNIFEQIVLLLSFLLFTPLFYVKLVLKKKISEYGMGMGNWRTGIFWNLSALLFCSLVFYLIFYYSGFVEKYVENFFQSIVDNFGIFLFYEIVILGAYHLIFEIFFGGFVLFSFKPIFKLWVIPLKAFLFLLVVWMSSELDWMIVPYLVFSLFSGVAIYYSRSIWYSFVSAILFNIIFDAIIINFYK